MSKPMFELGQIVATPGCLNALEATGQTPEEFLARHVAGDWGDVDAEDAALNDAAVMDGCRILSAYLLINAEKIWVITEATGDEGQRASTCMLLPEEY